MHLFRYGGVKNSLKMLIDFVSTALSRLFLPYPNEKSTSCKTYNEDEDNK